MSDGSVNSLSDIQLSLLIIALLLGFILLKNLGVQLCLSKINIKLYLVLTVISPGHPHVDATAPHGEQLHFHSLFRAELSRVVCFAYNSLCFILQSEENACLTK